MNAAFEKWSREKIQDEANGGENDEADAPGEDAPGEWAKAEPEPSGMEGAGPQAVSMAMRIEHDSPSAVAALQTKKLKFRPLGISRRAFRPV